MIKRFLVLAVIFTTGASFAQTVTTIKSKKGYEVLPQAGDFAIQLDASPFLNFAVEAIKIGSTNGVKANGLVAGGMTVTGKYFTSANKAYRVTLGINNFSDKVVTTLVNDINVEKPVVRTRKTKRSQVNIGGGLEWRRGHNRLQGYYGVEAMLTLGNFGQAAISTDYDVNLGELNTDAEYANMGISTTSSTKQSSLGLGVRGFAGVEYFVLPKISLGGGALWGINYYTNKSSVETSTWNAADKNIDTVTVDGPKGNTLDIRNYYSFNLVATFHF